jgi:hypothetical protein
MKVMGPALAQLNWGDAGKEKHRRALALEDSTNKI